MIERLNSFVKNGGRLREGDEPKFDEPFYGEYMKQFLPLHFKPGDRVRLQEQDRSGESRIFEGVIIALDHELKLLTSGKKSHKDRKNEKFFNYSFIKCIEMIAPGDGSFDLSVVDPDYWNWKNKYGDSEPVLDHRKTESRRIQRNEDRKEFHLVYPDVDFDKVHVIKICDGCKIYWPFTYNSISAEVFMVRGAEKITSVPCKTGTPFPNKNSFHVYNCSAKGIYPDLYLYLPDNGCEYEDINIVCVWTINTNVSGKDTVIKVVNLHHVGEIKPIQDERNMIFIDMSANPLLCHGISLFTEPSCAFLLTRMMNTDMYIISNCSDNAVVMEKLPEGQAGEEFWKYVDTSGMAIDGCNLQDFVHHIASEQEECWPYVEIFCNIDKEPERYYSSSWRSCRKGYQFKMLEK